MIAPLMLLFMTLAQALPPPPSPPPPPVAGGRSYDAIDRLGFLEGEWVGTRDHGTSHPTNVAWRIGRFGEGSDYLLIGEVEHFSDPPLAQFSPRDPHSLMIVEYNARRGGYRYSTPGFYDLHGLETRGADEPAAILLTGERELSWTMPITDQRERTIHVAGDHIDETLVYLPTHKIIYRTTLTRTPAHLIWGEPRPAG